VLLVEDAGEPDRIGAEPPIDLPAGAACLRLGNKADLIEPSRLAQLEQDAEPWRLWISARTGYGIERLRSVIRERVGGAPGGPDGPAGGSFSARQRHVDALRRAAHHLDAGRQVMADSQAGELLAEELRLAQQALGELTGELLPDDLLGEIFSSFCIGK
jgi:tRNA modification GTPase